MGMQNCVGGFGGVFQLLCSAVIQSLEDLDRSVLKYTE